MRRLRALWMRLMRAGRANTEFETELESHLGMHIDDGVRAGLSQEEARRQALIRLGGAEQARQAYRERKLLPFSFFFYIGPPHVIAKAGAPSWLR